MKRFKVLIKLVLIIWLLCRTEIDYGICLDSDKNGMIINTESQNNYINYSCTDAQEGDKVLTLFVLNPFNNYCDDFILRKDLVF